MPASQVPMLGRRFRLLEKLLEQPDLEILGKSVEGSLTEAQEVASPVDSHWDPEVPKFFFWGKKKCPSGALVWSANCYVRFFVFF